MKKLRTVRIHHQYTTCRSSILALDSSRIDLPASGHVGWVIDNRSDQSASTQIVFGVGTDFELDSQLFDAREVAIGGSAYFEMVEPLVQGFFGQPPDFLVRVAYT